MNSSTKDIANNLRVLIGWYVDGKLVETHSLSASAAVEKIANKQAYTEARYATLNWPFLRRTLVAQDAALVAETQIAA